jgi:hypothetical protein
MFSVDRRLFSAHGCQHAFFCCHWIVFFDTYKISMALRPPLLFKAVSARRPSPRFFENHPTSAYALGRFDQHNIKNDPKNSLFGNYSGYICHPLSTWRGSLRWRNGADAGPTGAPAGPGVASTPG